MAHKFTVILVRPDYMADNFGQDTYTAHIEVEDNDVEKAVQAAKKEVWTIDNSGSYGLDEDPAGEPEDYFCIAAFEGHLHTVYGD